MSFRNWITEDFILPISDLYLGQSISKNLRFLMKSQYYTRSEIESYQNKKLQKLIRHAYINVPFYREIFLDLKLKPEDIKSKEDLKKLPIITKSDLKKNRRKNMATNLREKDFLTIKSSGSTGEPFQYFSTRYAESFLMAAQLRGWYGMGYRLGDRYVKISINDRDSMLKRIQDKLNNCLYISYQNMSQEFFNRTIIDILKYNPSFIRSYGVPLKYISKCLKDLDLNISNFDLRGINTTGSTLHNDLREEVEMNFNTKIFDSYSCEGSAVFFECSKGLYHFSEEYAISEFIEDKYTLSNPERPLRHITTDLHNYAFPFIRYDTQDYIVLSKEKKCECDSNLSTISKINGRDGDILITPSGKYLMPIDIIYYFNRIEEVDQVQLVQEELNRIVINLKVNKSFNDAVNKKINQYWNNYFDNKFQVINNIVSKIELAPSGKQRVIIRNPKINI